RTDRSNMCEDRPFRSGAERPVLAAGEQRTVYVLVTGDQNHEEGREVCTSREDATARRDDLRSRGLLDARVREVLTNTWLVDL
ncbi:hypothetical protein, partial [Nocardioides sp. 616]|uniref:hypothetical protein n=1 Tax=Nocardioides sp. 616 TaxID=2268090 RepID=UPI0013B3649D